MTRPRAVLFDLDGTLTEPLLDFPRIKADMGIGDAPILEALAAMAGPDRARAEAVLNRHERDAAGRATLNPGCGELLAWLAGAGIGVGIVTRNSRASLERVVAEHGLPASVLISRDCCPPKPDPQPLLEGCRRLGTTVEQTWFVGDGVYDVQAAANAGMRCIWLSHGEPRPFPEVPWREVNSLPATLALLQAARVG
ncbi:MAG: HAD family hydrolase [Phycisphaerae bacterium]